MSENIDLTTETNETTEEQVVVEARVGKKTLQVAAIASLAGAAVAGAACFLARRNDDQTDNFVPVESVLVEDDTPEA